MAVLVAARGRARRSRIPRFESRPSAVLTSSPPETYQELVQVRDRKMLGCCRQAYHIWDLRQQGSSGKHFKFEPLDAGVHQNED